MKSSFLYISIDSYYNKHISFKFGLFRLKVNRIFVVHNKAMYTSNGLRLKFTNEITILFLFLIKSLTLHCTKALFCFVFFNILMVFYPFLGCV